MDVVAPRATASKIAKWLVERNRTDEALDLLCAFAASGPNDVEGQQLLAEALRLNPAAPIARQAFERMEGIQGDHAALDDALRRFDKEQITKFEREMTPPSFRRAQVGFNNNVKYKDNTYHVQTEDSGLDKPHIITHLFADGGRVIKSHKRTYATEVQRPDVAMHVRTLMKGQQMEMLLMLRDGKFDEIIAGRARGGMDLLTEPPAVDVKKVARKKADDAPPSTATPAVSVPTVSKAVDAGIVSAKAVESAPKAAAPSQALTKKVLARLHVQRSLVGGPEFYPLTEEHAIIGSQGTVKLLGDPYCHPREAAVFFREGRLILDDLEGGNGAFLRIRGRVELQTGDEFIAGDQLFRVAKNPAPDDEPDPDPTYFYSSPKWPSTFRVVQIFEGGALGACAVSRGGMVQIGGAIGDIVCPNDPLMSEQHCVLEEQAQVVVLSDLDTRTGVFVRLLGEAELSHGDEFIIGRTRLLVDLSPKPA